MAQAWDLPEPAVAGELLLEALLHVRAARHHGPAQAPRLVRHPAMSIDVAVVAPDTVPLVAIERAIREGAGATLDAIWWFDEFRGEQLPAAHRSVGFRLRLQDAERQLTDEDAERVLGAVGAAVAANGWSLRG
jgi:phenylalanyl-tRNA synthetase beta chain